MKENRCADQFLDERLVGVQAVGNDDGRQLSMAARNVVQQALASFGFAVLHRGAVGITNELGCQQADLFHLGVHERCRQNLMRVVDAAVLSLLVQAFGATDSL